MSASFGSVGKKTSWPHLGPFQAIFPEHSVIFYANSVFFYASAPTLLFFMLALFIFMRTLFFIMLTLFIFMRTLFFMLACWAGF